MNKTDAKTHSEFVETDFWEKVRYTLGAVPFMNDLIAAYYCAVDPDTPRRVRGILLGALGYFVLPVDLIPDIIFGFGFTDDATVLATAISIVSGHITSRHHELASQFLLREERR